jgi:peptidoglycan/LPS O-acetylase OafA/YrhL
MAEPQARKDEFKLSLDITGRPGLYPELDGIRAIAILLVLARHATLIRREGHAPFWPIGNYDAATLFLNGWSGVDLFFVLSGLLITLQLDRIFQRRESVNEGRTPFIAYVKRRVLRILPAYYAWLFVCVSGVLFFAPIAHENMAFRIAYHLVLLQDYLPADILVTFWSLGVEEKFYLAAPLLVGALRMRSTRIVIASLLSIAALCMLIRTGIWMGLPHPLDYPLFFRAMRSPFHASFDGLSIGMLVGLLVARKEKLAWLRDPRLAQGLVFTSLVASVALLTMRVHLDSDIGVVTGAGIAFALSLAFGALVLGLVLGRFPIAISLLGGRFLRFFAKLSYSLYLVHFVFVNVTDVLLLRSFAWYENASMGLRLPVHFVVYSALSIAAASLLHVFIEKPFLPHTAPRADS